MFCCRVFPCQSFDILQIIYYFCWTIKITNIKKKLKLLSLSRRVSHGRRGVPLQQERQRVCPLQTLRDDRHDEGRQDLLPDPVRRPSLQGCPADFNTETILFAVWEVYNRKQKYCPHPTYRKRPFLL